MSVHGESRQAVATSERPLRADAERNRRRILVAAGEVFAVRGLDAGLDEIARHAGVGVGTVYRRFPDKHMLIEALFDDRIGGLIDAGRTCRGRGGRLAGTCRLPHRGGPGPGR